MRVAIAALVAALAASSAAPAAPPCWKRLINDVYDDGRIAGVYSSSCYEAALEQLPEHPHGSEDELRKGLAAARARERRGPTLEAAPPRGEPSRPLWALAAAGAVAAAAAALFTLRSRRG